MVVVDCKSSGCPCTRCPQFALGNCDACLVECSDEFDTKILCPMARKHCESENGKE